MEAGRQVGTLANAVFIKETEKSGMCVTRSCRHADKSAIWQNTVHITYKVKNVLRSCRQVGIITRKAFIYTTGMQASEQKQWENLHIVYTGISYRVCRHAGKLVKHQEGLYAAGILVLCI